jgi:predicted DNA-binding transcriptional regulator AlpA
MPPEPCTEQPEGDRLLRMKGVARLLGVSRHVLYRVVKDPRSGFPPFLELAPGIRMVRERAVLAWLRRKELEAYERAAQR